MSKASDPLSDTRFSRKRTEIIRAAATAFGRKGFHATALDEIAADLNVTKASLYYYFSTKEELLFEVHRLMLEEILGRVDRIFLSESSPVVRLQAVITEHLRVFANDYEGAFLLQQEYELPPPLRASVIVLRDRYEACFTQIVTDGVRLRLFRVKDVRVAVRMMLGSLNWFLRWYRATGKLSVDEIAEAYIDFFLYGLLAPAPAGRLENVLAPATVRRAPGRRRRASR